MIEQQVQNDTQIQMPQKWLEINFPRFHQVIDKVEVVRQDKHSFMHLFYKRDDGNTDIFSTDLNSHFTMPPSGNRQPNARTHLTTAILKHWSLNQSAMQESLNALLDQNEKLNLKGGATRGEIVELSALGQEGRLLEPLSAALLDLTGSPLRALKAGTHDNFGIVLQFPTIPPSVSFGGSFLHNISGMSSWVRQYIADRGFGWDASDNIYTIPAPSQIQHFFPELKDAFFMPAFVPTQRLVFSPIDWLDYIRDGILAINVPASFGKKQHTLAKIAVLLPPIGPLRWPRDFLVGNLFSTPHDIGLHFLALHMMSRSALDDLRGRLKNTLKRGNRAEIKRITNFIEGRLTLLGITCLKNILEPEEFAPLFDQQLERCLKEVFDPAPSKNSLTR